MIRLQTYAALSFMATLAVTYHGFSSRGQFYPAMVYLSTSKISSAILLNMGLVIMCIMWQLTKKIFLGSLREAEVERLNEQSWREVMEILFAITIFRQDFSVTFLGMVTALLLIKALHWLAQKRVEYIETTPTVPILSHVRIVSFLGFLLLIDTLLLFNSVKYLLETREASVSLFFAFEYMILATTTVSTFVKYVFYVSDMLMEGQWEKKPVYTFYLELIRDLLHLSMYMCFFMVIFMSYGVPLHLIRELYETFRNFKIRIADYLRYRKITSNMNDRFPDATPEELDGTDAICIICREEMTTAKKLICGHLFHVHCLRSWLERQHTCPTCRAHVIPSESGTASTNPRVDGNQQVGPGSNSSNSSPQGSNREGTVDDSISQHQRRLQAAAAAASIYERSFVYPSANSVTWSPGFSPASQSHSLMGSSLSENASGEGSSTRQSQQFPVARMHSAQYPQGGFVPLQLPVIDNTNMNMSDSDLEAHMTSIQHQIEALQKQLGGFNKAVSEAIGDPAAASDKGKTIV
ncbi:ubiquitin-protein ligase [Lithospermum erythrorhizon]|uniref:RING-type E3 ubiquitin transferase n=1 Tax=Lithospermum erythrorhizon TaxID=34254 RepID=A0AAV3NWK8_LITER